MTPSPLERIVIAPAQRRRTVLTLIGSAQRTLELSIFRCDDRSILHAITHAVERGVRVRVILTGRARAAGRELGHLQQLLLERGAEVRRQSAALKYHAKYIVADDSSALVASLNFTAECFGQTCDFVLVTSDRQAVSGIAELFAADWERRPLLLTAPQSERLIVGPDQAPRERFVRLLRSARRRIRIIDPKLTDSRLLSELDARRAAGIRVETKGRGDLGTLAAHGKLLLVDETAAAVGSLSLRAPALQMDRDLAIVTHDAAVVRQLDAFWRSLPDAFVRHAVPQHFGQEMRP